MSKKRKHFYGGYHQGQDGRRLTEPMLKELTDVFNKLFVYAKPAAESTWNLPKSTELFTAVCWDEPTLIGLKTDINHVKDKLSDVDVVPWHEHTQFTHKAGKVMSRLRQTLGVEMCTQAWCKFHEILGKFQLIPEEGIEDFETVHICEAPGAFVASLNHRLKSHYKDVRWRWMANTLNPFYEGNDPKIMIDDATLIKDTLPNWYFGVDNTGDITKKGNILRLCEMYKSHKVSLVTADGSINCQNNPAEQEKLVAFLHYCEAVTALSLLKDGGHFVIKMFTLFETESISLLYLLNCLFEKVNIIKPATSKPGNSELYVVCEKFTGVDESILYKLLEMCENESFHRRSMFSVDHIPQRFLAQHIAACRKFKAFQEETIESNFNTFQTMCPGDRHNMEFMKEQCARMYIEIYQVFPIPVKDRVVPHKIQGRKKMCTTGTMLFSTRKALKGSYNERQKLGSLPWRDRVVEMKSYDVEDLSTSWLEYQNPTYLIKNLDAWKPIVGERINAVLSSRFCHQELLGEYTSLIENSQFLKSSSLQDILFPEDQLHNTCLNLIKLLNLTDDIECKVTGNETRFVHRLQEELHPRGDREANKSRGIGLVLSDVCSVDIPFRNGEVTTQRQLLSFTIEALKSLGVGGSFICHIYTALTRYVVGLIYILTHCFTQVTVDDFSLDSLSPSSLLICKNLISCPPQLLNYLETMVTQEDEMEVLQFVPTDCFLDSVFQSSICSMNESLMMRRINTWLKMELTFIADS